MRKDELFLIEPSNKDYDNPTDEIIHRFSSTEDLEAFFIRCLVRNPNEDFSDWLLIRGQEISFQAHSETNYFVDVTTNLE